MKLLPVIIVLVSCVLATGSPIIRVKTVNGQKKSYCCYGVVRPFDMMAKAKQGLRALNQVGYSLKQVRQALGIQQKTLEGKLEKAEKKAEAISAKVVKALKATMRILTDATKKAAAKLSDVADASNDLAQLGKDIEETKSADMMSRIRELISEKPANDEKPDKKNHDNEKPKTESKANKEKDQEKSKKQHKELKPKDSIPSAHDADENAVARSLLNQEHHETEEVKKAKDAIDEKAQANKRALEKTKDFLKQIEDGLQLFENVF